MKMIRTAIVTFASLFLLSIVVGSTGVKPVEAKEDKPICRCAPDLTQGKLPTDGKWAVQCYDSAAKKFDTCKQVASTDLCDKSGAKVGIDCNPITDAVVSGPFQIPTVGALLTSLIRLFFFIAGLLSLIYILLGAFEWVRSGGKEEDIEGAQKKIMAAVIGLVVMVAVLTLVIIIEQVIFSGTVCLGVSCPLKLDDIRLVTPN